MLFKNLSYFILFFIFLSCSSQGVKNLGNPDTTQTINCSNTNISVSKQDNIVIQHATNPVLWKGTYTKNTVKISFTKTTGNDGETITFKFVFQKENNCLKIIRAFKFYNGSKVDVSAITEMDVSEFYTKEWILDKKFSGLITYIDPHDKKVYTRKFWIEFTAQDLEIENTNYLIFNDYFANKLPIDIDINKDGIVDYKIVFEKIRDIGNRPQFNKYTIKLISTYESENKILSPIKNQSPYTVIFEAPFTSENTRHYVNDVKNALDVFYEFDAPYQNYNYYLHNNLTYKGILENSKEDYYLIKMGLGNKDYYGWIKFKFNSTLCNVEVLGTYLNTTPNQHISVN